ncbi:hypothetical protein T11_7883, partial [Trichinella zimbabwensis]
MKLNSKQILLYPKENNQQPRKRELRIMAVRSGEEEEAALTLSA